jgi:hypothetical protein
MSSFVRLGIVVGISLLAGCVGTVPLGEPGVREEDVLGRSAQLHVGTTTREQVHATLGEPLLADERASAEVFRITGKQRQMAVFFVPYPIPMPAPSAKQDGYTLVTYDDEGVLFAVDGALTTSAGFEPTAQLVLWAGDHEFVHGRSDRLLVRQERFLRDRAAGADAASCTLLVGCEQRCADAAVAGIAADDCGVCWTRLQLDDGPVQELPLVEFVLWPLGEAGSSARSAREATCVAAGGRVTFDHCALTRHQLVPLRLTPGPHSLRATSATLRGEVSSRFECEPGGLLFVTLAGAVTERYSLSRQVKERFKTGAATGSVSFGPGPSPALRGQPIVLNW